MILRILLLKILILITCSAFASERLYKYVDSQGDTIISNNLPAEYANNGYAIVTPRGNVLEIVPPKKSDEELAHELEAEKIKFAEKQRKEALEKARLEQERKDDILLKTFASEQAIIRNRDDKIRSIEVLEDITKENVTRLREQLQQAQRTAAEFERNGKLTPKTIIQTIEDSKRQIHENLDFLMKKSQEKDNIKAKYENMLSRFRHLKE